jgi:DNA/RNA-binding domain of Phe-tRNA-synthetase-like protein
MITVDDHPLLDLHAFEARFPRALGQLASPQHWLDLLASGAVGPMTTDDGVKLAVRNLLRHGGFKPSGRSKPASEYLLKAAAGGFLGPINPVVDACNVVSLHSGLPISVVDVDRTDGELSVSICPPETSYVFNASGQEIRLDGLVALHDGQGPCANAVKDCQRTKTHEGTTRVVCLVWGVVGLAGRGEEAAIWYRRLLEEVGATTEALA